MGQQAIERWRGFRLPVPDPPAIRVAGVAASVAQRINVGQQRVTPRQRRIR